MGSQMSAPLPKSGHPPVVSIGHQIGGGLPSPPWGPLGGVSHLDPLELGFTPPLCLWGPSLLDPPPHLWGASLLDPPPCLWAPSFLDPPHVYGLPPSWTPPTFMGSLPPGPPHIYGVPPSWTPPHLWGPYGLPNESPPPQNQGRPSKHLQPGVSPTPMGASHLSSVGWAASWGPCGGAAGGPWGVPGGPCGAADPPSPPSSGGPDPRLEVSIGDPSRALLTAVSASESSARSGDREAGKWGAETPNGGRIPSMGPKPHKWRPNPIYGSQTPQMEAESHLWGPNPPNGGRIPSMGPKPPHVPP